MQTRTIFATLVILVFLATNVLTLLTLELSSSLTENVSHASSGI